MKKNSYIGFFLSLLILFTGCELNEPDAFKTADTNVAFDANFSARFSETDGRVGIPVVLAGVPGGVKVKVTIASSTDGLTGTTAIEGTDYTIENKTIEFNNGFGIDSVYVNIIDNDEFTGNKTFNLVLESISPDNLKKNVASSITVTIIDDEHPWAALIGTYTISAKSLFDGSALSIPAVVSANEVDINTLNIVFNTGSTPTAAEMKIKEEGGDITISIADNQYIGVLPKPTGAWNRYFRATHYDEPSDDLFTLSSLKGVFKDGVITCTDGFGIEAINPGTGASGGFFTLTLDGVKFTKR